MNLINLFYRNEYFIRIIPYYFTGYDEKGGIMNMQENDTICLLKECDAGSKMAVSAIDEIMEKVHCPDFKDLLNKTKDHHAALGNDIHAALLECHSGEKDPNPFAKGMAWMKTNMQMGIDESDETAADLMTSGCDMGIKSLYKYMNQYKDASEDAKELCKRLISIEEELRKCLHTYL